ncbi:uncharacterized protein DMAD_07454, partial [Drosophila madeirensis]
MGKGVPD